MSTLNMRIRQFRFVAAAIFCSALVLGGCDEMAGSTSTGNTGKGSISGRVVDASGQGVGNARVKVFSVTYNPGPNGAAASDVADVVVTKADGSFMTDSLTEGRYNLFGDKGGLLALQDSIPVTSTSETQSGNLELKQPGSVTGVVRLHAGHDSRTVFLLLPGTPVFAVPQDSIGNFKIGPLAEGNYHLRLLSILDNYKPLDTILTVFPGVDTVLKDTLRLAYQGSAFGELPLVESVNLSIDTSRILFNLSWPKSKDPRVVAYLVYRRKPGMAYELATTTPLTDTIFSEDWNIDALNNKILLPGDSLQYVVTTLDKLGNESRKPDPIAFVIPAVFRAELVTQDPDWLQEFSEVAPDGSVWGFDYNSHQVIRLGSTGQITGWADSSIKYDGSEKMVIDGAGDVYALYLTDIPVTQEILAKYSPTGILQWKVVLTSSTIHQFTRDEQSIIVATDDKIWTHYDEDGHVIKVDTLSESTNTSPRLFIHKNHFKLGIGYYRILEYQNMDSSIVEFLDDKGQVKSTWEVPFAEFDDIERDEMGRWYFSSKEIYVYSPQQIFVGIFPYLQDGIEGGGQFINRNNRMFMFKPDGTVYRIRP
jgi:hypothetical protein